MVTLYGKTTFARSVSGLYFTAIIKDIDTHQTTTAMKTLMIFDTLACKVRSIHKLLHFPEKSEREGKSTPLRDISERHLRGTS